MKTPIAEPSTPIAQVSCLLSLLLCATVASAEDLVWLNGVEVESGWSCAPHNSQNSWRDGLELKWQGSCGRLAYQVWGEYDSFHLPVADSIVFGAEFGYYDGASWGVGGAYGGTGNQSADETDSHGNLYYGLRLGASFFDSSLRPYLRGGFHSVNSALGTARRTGNWTDFASMVGENMFYGLGIEYEGSDSLLLRGGWDRLTWGGNALGGYDDASVAPTEEYYGLSIIYQYR
ncbi:MAG: hypothetical protein ACNYPG_04510 [Candidatus Porifericomitaceae bacterium WSBS_2022_MAG_OTU9]